MKRSYAFIWYGTLFFAILGPLIFLTKTFSLGDYRVQFFPWSYHYAESLRAGTLPYWTTLISNGFPLMAEGQVAGYYFLHLAAYFLLPFKAAYTWLIPLHILIGGVGFYFYARRVGLREEGAALAAVLFSFSSAYGGCFYTTGTLRVLSWLPWCLWVLDVWLSGSPRRDALFHALGAGMLFAQMWLAGFPQLAVYAFFYLFLLLLLDARRRIEVFVLFMAASVIGVLLALPQFLQTLELARVSVRSAQDAAFALWGSVPPVSIVSLLFPRWGHLLHVSFYLGAVSLIFIFVSLFTRKKPFEKAHAWLALIFFLLAIGKYNPIYKFLVETFSVTAFRNPSKFIFFSAISLSLLAGAGFDKRLQGTADGRLVRRIGFSLLAAVFLLPLILQAVLSVFGPALDGWARSYAESVYASKANPARSVEQYHAMIREFFQNLKNAADLRDPWIWRGAFFLMGGILLGARRWLLAALIGADLIFFSAIGIGFIGNASAPPPLTPVPILREVQNLTEEKSLNAVEWTNTPSRRLMPAAENMLYGIPHAGAYSPLLGMRYYELTRELGITDASLGYAAFSKAVWDRQRALVDLAGIGVILSDEPLEFEDFRLLKNESGRYLYENPNALPPQYPVSQWKIFPEKSERLAYLKSPAFDPAREAVLEAAPPQEEGVIIVSRQNFYSRIAAEADGVRQKVFPVNHAFCGIFVDKGVREARFFYDASVDHRLEFLMVFFWLAALGVLGFRWKRAQV